jgi:hypothetical protein
VILACQASTVASSRMSQPRPQRPAQLWLQGPRDSALAVGVACDLVLSLSTSAANECRLEGFQQTPTGYRLRVREIAPPGAKGAGFPLAEMWLTTDGRSATVERSPEL